MALYGETHACVHCGCIFKVMVKFGFKAGYCPQCGRKIITIEEKIKEEG